jgi:DNA-binding NarL/FixJ family response regulator
LAGYPREQEESTVRILVLDDHRLFLDGLRHVLETMDQVTGVEEAQSTEQALKLLDAGRGFNLILADLSMPGLDGFAFLAALRQRRITTPVVVISGTSEPADVRRALDNGALGFIPKSMGSAELKAALHDVMDGEIFVPPDMWPSVLEGSGRVHGESVAGHGEASGIGPRQMEVLRLMADGHSNRDIALLLNISEATVKAHVSQLFRALNVKNRTACVREATKRELLTLAGQ